MTAEVKPTNCHYCGYCCAFLATVEDGRVTDLVPDPSRYPYDESQVLAGMQALAHERGGAGRPGPRELAAAPRQASGGAGTSGSA